MKRFERLSLLGGAVGLAACVLGAVVAPHRLFPSYLVAFLFWAGVGLGSLAVLMIHHMAGGGWGFPVRRVLEAAAGTAPLLFALFLPLLAGLEHLYPWANGADLPAAKLAYLNPPFFVSRAALYFAVWVAIAALLARLSRREDESGNPEFSRRMRLWSGPGLLLYGVTASFAAVDWAMSLEPLWASSLYGLLVLGGQMLSAFAFAAAAAAFLRRDLAPVLTPGRLNDLGNLLLAFVMIWAYLHYSQFLIIWSGNLPEEAPWYLARSRAGWGAVAGALVTFHFAIPFVLLLSRRTKRDPRRLAAVAVALLAMRFVDVHWLIVPAFRPHPTADPLDLAAVAGVGGIWLGAFAHRLGSRPLVPRGDPRALPAPEGGPHG